MLDDRIRRHCGDSGIDRALNLTEPDYPFFSMPMTKEHAISLVLECQSDWERWVPSPEELGETLYHREYWMSARYIYYRRRGEQYGFVVTTLNGRVTAFSVTKLDWSLVCAWGGDADFKHKFEG